VLLDGRALYPSALPLKPAAWPAIRLNGRRKFVNSIRKMNFVDALARSSFSLPAVSARLWLCQRRAGCEDEERLDRR